MNLAQQIRSALGCPVVSIDKARAHKKARSNTKKGPGRYHGDGKIKP